MCVAGPLLIDLERAETSENTVNAVNGSSVAATVPMRRWFSKAGEITPGRLISSNHSRLVFTRSKSA